MPLWVSFSDVRENASSRCDESWTVETGPPEEGAFGIWVRLARCCCCIDVPDGAVSFLSVDLLQPQQPNRSIVWKARMEALPRRARFHGVLLNVLECEPYHRHWFGWPAWLPETQNRCLRLGHVWENDLCRHYRRATTSAHHAGVVEDVVSPLLVGWLVGSWLAISSLTSRFSSPNRNQSSVPTLARQDTPAESSLGYTVGKLLGYEDQVVQPALVFLQFVCAWVCGNRCALM